MTLQIALFVIGVAGFGRKVSWKDDTVVPPGYTMSFKEALHVVSTGTIVKAIVPNWALGLSKHFRHVRDAFTELDVRPASPTVSSHEQIPDGFVLSHSRTICST